jgi:hypothetical protein
VLPEHGRSQGGGGLCGYSRRLVEIPAAEPQGEIHPEAELEAKKTLFFAKKCNNSNTILSTIRRETDFCS